MQGNINLRNLNILFDSTRGNGIETLNLRLSLNYNSAINFTDSDNNWTSTEFHNSNMDDGALDAHWGAMKTYDYFKYLPIFRKTCLSRRIWSYK